MSKIRNAESTLYDNIKFKSKLEVLIYKTLKEYNYSPVYESNTFHLITFDKPNTIPFYERDIHKNFVLNNKKIIDIKYTPDFYVKIDNINVYIEAKGYENDTFYLKKKLFRKYLEELKEQTNEEYMYFEVYTKKELLLAINIVKDYANSLNKN